MLVLQCISKIILGCAVVNPPYSTEIITVPDGSGHVTVTQSMTRRSSTHLRLVLLVIRCSYWVQIHEYSFIKLFIADKLKQTYLY